MCGPASAADSCSDAGCDRRARPGPDDRGNARSGRRSPSLRLSSATYTFLPDISAIENSNYVVPQIESPPTQLWGVILICVRRCPTFPPGLGSIIGAGRLSFRVRDGSGRFPAAIDRRNFIYLCGSPWCGGWCYLVVGRGWFERVDVWLRVCVSFRPVSASSLRLLLVL